MLQKLQPNESVNMPTDGIIISEMHIKDLYFPETLPIAKNNSSKTKVMNINTYKINFYHFRSTYNRIYCNGNSNFG